MLGPALVPDCPECGHDLGATIEAGWRRCPECGFTFDLDMLARGGYGSRMARRHAILGVYLFVLLVVVGLVLVAL